MCVDAWREYARQKHGHEPRVRNHETSAQKKQRVNSLLLQSKIDRGSCLDCGLQCTQNNWFVFDYDHRDPTLKSFTIGQKKHSVSTEVLLAEIAKCDLVCSNCHRHRTFGQMKADVISSHNHIPADIPSLFDLL